MKKTIVSLFVLVAALCGSALAQDCVNINGRNICASSFSHDDLVVAKSFLDNDEEYATVDTMISELALGETLLSIMQKSQNSEAIIEVNNQLETGIDDAVSSLSLGSFDGGIVQYLFLQSIYENQKLFKQKLPIISKLANASKAIKAFESRFSAYFLISSNVKINDMTFTEYKRTIVTAVEKR